MKLVVLAAGQGRRLRPLTNKVPKPAVRLTDGDSILGKSLRNITENHNIAEIIIICGYKKEKMQDVIHTELDDLPIRSIYNPFYDEAGPVASLWGATHEFLQEDTVIINGDTLFFECPHLRNHSNEVSMLYSQPNQYSEDDMKVISDENGYLMEVGKDIDESVACGVSAGSIFLFGEEVRHEFIRIIGKSLSCNINEYWHELFNKLVNNGYSVKLVETSQDNWHEIDTISDFEYANKLVSEKS